MFRASSIRDVDVQVDDSFVRALIGKLNDIDSHRIASNDALVLRKAVLGLLEIVAELEQRLVALEGDDARADWQTRLAQHVAESPPEYVVSDDKETAG